MLKHKQSDFDFMVALEADYREVSGLENQEFYKIFYSPVHPADILLLGINPGGNPNAPDSIIDLNKDKPYQDKIKAYCEEENHDLLDYAWKENQGLLKLLIPVCGSKQQIKEQVVKTNLAFRRSPNARNEKFIGDAKLEAKPFLLTIIDRVSPKLVLLAGCDLAAFCADYCIRNVELSHREVYPKVNQTIFWSAKGTFSSGKESLIVSTAHASRFSWIYLQYDVPNRIASLLSKTSL